MFIQTNHPFSYDGTPLLTNNHWYVAKKLLSFLQLFYHSIVILSSVYYPTALLMLHQILKIARYWGPL
jgi:hypothetical protein